MRYRLSAAALIACLVTDPSARADAAGPKPGPDVLYWAPATSPQLENTGNWRAAPLLISGVSAYRNGEFLYQDYLFDDRGAGQRALYPASVKAATNDNGADLVEMRIKPLANATAIRLTYNTMIDPEVMAATIALGDGAAKANLPFGAGGAMPATIFVTIHGTTAVLTDAATGATLAQKAGVSIDKQRRQVEIRVPFGVFDPRGKTNVRVAAGVGLWDRAAGRYMAPADPPAPPPPEPGAAAPPNRRPLAPLPEGRSLFFNMAFRHSEPQNTNSQLPFYNDIQQGDVLLKGDLSPFHASVDFTKLAAGVTDESGIPKTGYMSRILVTHFEPAQGRGKDGQRLGPRCTETPCIPQFASRLQAYGIYVPTKAPPASGYGLTLDLHSASATYARWIGTSRGVQFGERGTGSIVVTPSARGASSSYFSEAAAEVFEVWADVERHYKIDRDYVSLAGVSMGAIGSFKLAGQFPDLFAAMAVSVGCPTNPSLIGLREVPAMIHTGDIDTQTQCRPGNAALERYVKATDQYLWWNFMDHPHPFSSRPRDWQPFADFLGDKKRAPDPARVTYAVLQAAIEPRFGINADHAYWVSGLKIRDANGLFAADKADPQSMATPYGEIDVFSYGFGRGEAPRVAPARDTGIYRFGVEDYPWPNYISFKSERASAPAAPVQDALDITAKNIAAVAIDPARAKISCDAKLNVKSDGPISVILIGCPGGARKF